MALLVLRSVGLCVRQNQMCHLCGGILLVFFCLYAAKISLSFCRLFCLFTMNANGFGLAFSAVPKACSEVILFQIKLSCLRSTNGIKAIPCYHLAVFVLVLCRRKIIININIELLCKI